MGQEVPMEKMPQLSTAFIKIRTPTTSHRLSICRTTITRTTNASRNSLIPRRDEMTLAAHAGDPEKIFSKEEIEKIHDYLDEIDAKYQQSISSDKRGLTSHLLFLLSNGR